jgi:hypothetical protein
MRTSRSTAFVTSVLVLALAVGCKSLGLGGKPQGGRPVDEVDQNVSGSAQHSLGVVALDDHPLPQKEIVPIRSAPEDLAFWVPPHEDPSKQMLIGGHYIVVEVRSSEWFPERTVRKLAEADVAATDEDFRFAANAVYDSQSNGGVVPYWGGGDVGTPPDKR